jgi:hypothetical protein
MYRIPTYRANLVYKMIHFSSMVQWAYAISFRHNVEWQLRSSLLFCQFLLSQLPRKTLLTNASKPLISKAALEPFLGHKQNLAKVLIS